MHTDGKSGFFQASYGCFVFSDIYIGRISRAKKKEGKSPDFHLSVCAQSISCKKITSKCIVLSGAWPIYLSGSDLAGPARTCSVITGMRGAKAGVSPPRRSLLRILLYFWCALLLYLVLRLAYICCACRIQQCTFSTHQTVFSN